MFEWRHYEMLSQMGATSVQSVVKQHQSSDKNQLMTGSQREVLQFGDVQFSECCNCNSIMRMCTLHDWKHRRALSSGFT